MLMQYRWSTIYYRSKHFKVLNQDTAIVQPLSPDLDPDTRSPHTPYLYKPETFRAPFTLGQS